MGLGILFYSLSEEYSSLRKIIINSKKKIIKLDTLCLTMNEVVYVFY